MGDLKKTTTKKEKKDSAKDLERESTDKVVAKKMVKKTAKTKASTKKLVKNSLSEDTTQQSADSYSTTPELEADTGAEPAEYTAIDKNSRASSKADANTPVKKDQGAQVSENNIPNEDTNSTAQDNPKNQNEPPAPKPPEEDDWLEAKKTG